MLPLLIATAVFAPPRPVAPACPPPAPCICVCQSHAPSAPAPAVAAPSGDSAPIPVAPSAFAPVPSAPSPAASPTGERGHWYGAPAVAIDVAAFALVAGGIASQSESALFSGVALYALGAPIVHLAKGHPSRALASLGIRTLGGGLATGAVLMDVLSHPCDGEPSCQHEPSTGFALGALVLLGAMVIDDAWVARETVTARQTATRLGGGVVLGPGLALFSLGGNL